MDIRGNLFVKSTSDIFYRLSAALTSENVKIRMFFFPSLLKKEDRKKIEEEIENWVRIHDLKHVKIFFCDNIIDVIENILEDKKIN